MASTVGFRAWFCARALSWRCDCWVSSGNNLLNVNVNVEWERGVRAVTLCMPIPCAKALEGTQWDSARLGSCGRAVRHALCAAPVLQALPVCRLPRWLLAGITVIARGRSGEKHGDRVGRGQDGVHVQNRAG